MSDEKRQSSMGDVTEVKDLGVQCDVVPGLEGLTSCAATSQILARMQDDQISTAWDRQNTMKPCPIGAAGVCCNTCKMGPCRLIEGKEGKDRGVCGVTIETVVARQFGKFVAAGTACHSDHGREVAELMIAVSEEKAPGYRIKDTIKLYALAEEWGIELEGRSDLEIGGDVGRKALAEFSNQHGEGAFISRAPAKRIEKWREMGIIPRGNDREVVELMHRTNQGMDQQYKNLMKQVSRTAMADGWIGSMVATELQDIIFGTPAPATGEVNLGVLEPDYVNLVFHGHEPSVTELMVEYSLTPEVQAKAEAVGAKGFNMAGICCTANEQMVRHGVSIAGSYSAQEVVMGTGIVDGMVVDVQCVIEGLGEVAKHYHTKLLTTSPKAMIEGVQHVETDHSNAQEQAKAIVDMVIENFKNRDPSKINPVKDKMPAVAGYSFEYIKYMLGGKFRASFRPLNDAIIDGRIRGVAAVVGCDTPVTNNKEGTSEAAHVELVKKLIANDVLVVQTGCSATVSGKAGLLTPEAMEMAGPGLRSICEAVGIGPVLHAGACVDNSRILVALAEMVHEGGIGEDIDELPVAGAAPDWMDAKAIAIGQYFVDYGVYVAFRPTLPVTGSTEFQKYIFEDYEQISGGKWAQFDKWEDMADGMLAHIDKKREALGINGEQERVLYDMEMRRDLEV